MTSSNLASMRKTSILDIPEEVIESALLPLFGINELLRLRRVCKRTKSVSDDYLRLHPRSQNQVSINLCDEVEEDDASSIETLLCRDNSSSIKLPITRFRLIFRSVDIYCDPRVIEFVQRYGQQVEHLEISHVTLPLSEREQEFYEKLRKLRSLTVFHAHEVECLMDKAFPGIFKNLKSLKIVKMTWLNLPESNHLCRMLEYCKNLEFFGFPAYHGMELEEFLILFKKVRQILEHDERPRGVTYDLKELRSKFYQEILSEVMVNPYSKLQNVYPGVLLSCNHEVLQATALQVVSLQALSVSKFVGDPAMGAHDPCIPLPNIQEIQVSFTQTEGLGRNAEVVVAVSPELHLMEIRRRLSIFPALKKLEVLLPRGFGDPGLLSLMWDCFTNLEEVTFTNNCEIKDVAFIGINGERPFLNLTRLKKLNLGILNPRGTLTDAVFVDIFQHMRLREFLLRSERPLESITSAGIQALRTGSFMECIEKFPFHGWSLADLDDDEFKLLGRNFPHNQEL